MRATRESGRLAPTALVWGTTEQADGDWQEAQLERRLDQLKRLVELRHRHRPKRVVWTDQVHGSKVLPVDEIDGDDGSLGAVDGLVTDQPDVLLTVRTADCVPVILEANRAVGVVHAGMAGAVTGVLPRAIRAMRRLYNIKPERLSLRFGPHICRSCYRLSNANEAFLADHPEAAEYVTARGHHRYFALLDLLSAQAAGLKVGRMTADNRCTYHSSGLFSARRGHPHRSLTYVMRASLTTPRA